MSHPAITLRPEGWEVRIKVVPGAKQDGLAGVLGDRLKVRVRAPPEDGRANQAVCDLLQRLTGARRVSVVAGPTSPQKTLRLEGGDPAGLGLPSVV